MMAANMEQAIERCEVCGLVDHHIEHGVCERCSHRVSWYKQSDLRLLLALLTEEQMEDVKRRVLDQLSAPQADLYREQIMSLPGGPYPPLDERIEALPKRIQAALVYTACRVLEGGPALLQEQAF